MISFLYRYDINYLLYLLFIPGDLDLVFWCKMSKSKCQIKISFKGGLGKNPNAKKYMII